MREEYKRIVKNADQGWSFDDIGGGVTCLAKRYGKFTATITTSVLADMNAPASEGLDAVVCEDGEQIALLVYTPKHETSNYKIVSDLCRIVDAMVASYQK